MARRHAAPDPSDQAAAGQGGEPAVESVAEVAIPASSYDPDLLKHIASFDDAVAAAHTTMGGIVAADQELGDGFALLDNKRKGSLVGIPLVLLEWWFRPGERGNTEYVAIRTVARHEGGSTGKYIVTDGGAGIYRQLKDYTAKSGRTGGLMVRGGLRRSDYVIRDESGNEKESTTFYLDTGGH
jgi:hypothetical protein